MSNYRIVTLGGPGRGGSLIGHVTRVRKAVYNAAAGTVTLYMSHRLDIHNRYRFTIAGAAPDGLMGTDGVHLDGAANGIAGSDYVGYITEKTLAGRASEATRASLTSEFGVNKVAHAISRSAIDMLAVSGQLTPGRIRQTRHLKADINGAENWRPPTNSSIRLHGMRRHLPWRFRARPQRVWADVKFREA